ncbi:MAG TPA: peptidylprolyl isomerase [Hyphomonadaceae bacterium]|nr:peptidylprolyl isomerase [Hyphomonadaceae bacterium]
MAVRNRLFLVGAAGTLALGLALSGCGKPAAKGAEAATADASAVAAVVNGEQIYVSDVLMEAEMEDLTGPDGKGLEVDSAEFNEVLDKLIDIKLLALEAKSRGLDEDAMARHRLETARENILANILVDQVVKEKVDEAAVKKMYDAQIAIFELGEEAHIRHILAKSKDDIDKIAAQLKSGADFAVVASKLSADDATKMDGGDLGYMTADEATPEFAKAMKETATGGVSKPFEDQQGWHVIKIDERRKEAPPTMEDLRDPILKHLTLMQMDEVLKQLRTEAKIEKHTSPRNSTLDVDPFTLPPDDAKAAPPPPVASPTPEASAPAADARPPTPAPAKPGAAPAPAKPAPAKPTTAKPASSPAPAAVKPAATAPTTPSAKPAASPQPQQPSGPVSESRPGAQPPAAPPASPQ